MAKRASAAAEASHVETEELGTRERLLLTAERLIAEAGVGQVSMRQVNAEAGARNLSAVHYHFGSLDGVIAAILEYRMAPIERRRSAMLDEMVADKSKQVTVRDVLHAVVWPLAEQMLTRAGENHYIGFVAATYRTPRLDSWKAVNPRYRRGLVRSYIMLRRLLPGIPKEVLHTRILMEWRLVSYALADLDMVIRARHPGMRDPLVLFHTSDLVTRMAVALAAPLSESTQMARRVLQANAESEKAPLFGMDAMWALSGKTRGSAT